MSRLVGVKLNHSVHGQLALDCEVWPDGGVTILSGDRVNAHGPGVNAELTAEEIASLQENDEVGEAAVEAYREMVSSDDPE